jgi:hypothetical protein
MGWIKVEPNGDEFVYHNFLMPDGTEDMWRHWLSVSAECVHCQKRAPIRLREDERETCDA